MSKQPVNTEAQGTPAEAVQRLNEAARVAYQAHIDLYKSWREAIEAVARQLAPIVKAYLQAQQELGDLPQPFERRKGLLGLAGITERQDLRYLTQRHAQRLKATPQHARRLRLRQGDR